MYIIRVQQRNAEGGGGTRGSKYRIQLKHNERSEQSVYNMCDRIRTRYIHIGDLCSIGV